MHSTNRYDCMICSQHFRHPITTEEQRVLQLTRKEADKTFSYGGVNAVTSVIQVANQLFPKSIEIAQGFLHQLKDVSGIRVIALFKGILELGTGMSHAAEMVCIKQLVIKVHIDITTVRLKRTDLAITKNMLQHIMAA